MIENTKKRSCEVCGEVLVFTRTRHIKKKRFCSKSCRLSYLHSPECNAQKSVSMQGVPHPHKRSQGLRYKKSGYIPSEETRQKIRLSLLGRNKGSNSPCWKGGLSSVNERLRNSVQYRRWRLLVFQRDGFACMSCRDNTGGNLRAHHILAWSLYPNLRFDVNNGTTLCNECHNILHYGEQREKIS